MLFRSKFITILLSIVLALFIFNNCSDDSPTGADDPGQPPEIPEASPVEIDNSLFQNNSPTGEEYEAFNEAGSLAQIANSNLLGATSMGQAFLTFANNQNAVFEDGLWVWTFSYAAEGESISIRSTAEEMPGGYEWNLYLSGNFEGETVDEFRYLSGFISDDGTSGSWQYYFPDETGNHPYITYEWERQSDNQFTFSSVISFPDEEGELRIDFVRDGDDNLLEFSGFDFEQDATVYWNSANGTGYIDHPGQDRKCWDQSFAETTCG